MRCLILRIPTKTYIYIHQSVGYLQGLWLTALSPHPLQSLWLTDLSPHPLQGLWLTDLSTKRSIGLRATVSGMEIIDFTSPKSLPKGCGSLTFLLILPKVCGSQTFLLIPLKVPNKRPFTYPNLSSNLVRKENLVSPFS